MSKVLCKVSKATRKIQDLVWSGSLALGVCMTNMVAHANNVAGKNQDATEAAQQIVKNIGKIVCVPGVFLMIFGFIHYAEARAEGDGPAKNKAIAQLTAGIMVILVGILLWGGAFNGVISSFTTM